MTLHTWQRLDPGFASSSGWRLCALAVYAKLPPVVRTLNTTVYIFAQRKRAGTVCALVTDTTCFPVSTLTYSDFDADKRSPSLF